MTEPARTEGLSGAFRTFSHRASQSLGSSWAFIGALGIVLVWAVSGPIFGFSENWQLIINTGTTIVTFLMIFLVQNTQNRDTMAIQLKLDELLRALPEARNKLPAVEDLSDEDLSAMVDEYRSRGRTSTAG